MIGFKGLGNCRILGFVLFVLAGFVFSNSCYSETKYADSDIAWGEVVNGLQAGIALADEKALYAIGENVSFHFFLKNTSNDVITVSDSGFQTYVSNNAESFNAHYVNSFLASMGWIPDILDNDGWKMVLKNPKFGKMNGFEEKQIVYSIEPQKIINYRQNLSFCIYPEGSEEKVEKVTLYADPGNYKLEDTYEFKSDNPSYWSGKITSGQIDLKIVPDSSNYKKCLYFDGINDYLDIPDSEVLNIKDGFTIELWVNVNDVPGECSILSKETPWDSGYTIIVDKGVMDNSLYSVKFGLGNGSGFTNVIAPDCIEKGKWAHISAVWDGQKAGLYVNGKLYINQYAPPPAVSRVPLRLGKGSMGLGRYFKGQADELRIWNIARTQKDIEKDYNNTLKGDESHLVGYWNFNEILGQKIYDKTFQGNNGILGKSMEVEDDDPARIDSPVPKDAVLFEKDINFLGQDNYPEVIALDPPYGSKNIDWERKYITVTFNQSMESASSFVDRGLSPGINEVEWINDRQCRAWVDLEPDHEYGIWLNYDEYTADFKNKEGVSAERVYWKFQTAPKNEISNENIEPVTETMQILATMESANGCEMKEKYDCVELTFPHGKEMRPHVKTKKLFSPPFAVKVRAKTDSTNVRLYYGDNGIGILIFNWEVRQNELRVHDPETGRITSVPMKGEVTPNEWHNFVWEIAEKRMRILVDGEERFRKDGNYSEINAPLGIGPSHGSLISVMSFVVEPLSIESEIELEQRHNRMGNIYSKSEYKTGSLTNEDNSVFDTMFEFNESDMEKHLPNPGEPVPGPGKEYTEKESWTDRIDIGGSIEVIGVYGKGINSRSRSYGQTRVYLEGTYNVPDSNMKVGLGVDNIN